MENVGKAFVLQWTYDSGKGYMTWPGQWDMKVCVPTSNGTQQCLDRLDGVTKQTNLKKGNRDEQISAL